MQFFTGISRNTQLTAYACYMLSLTECIWEFQNNALWDTHYHADDEPTAGSQWNTLTQKHFTQGLFQPQNNLNSVYQQKQQTDLDSLCLVSPK